MARVELLMQVKICGVCRPEDARMAADAGADYVGVILTPGWVRSQTVENAAAIYDAAGSAQRAGVFVDATVHHVQSLAGSLGLDIVQLHGNETPADVAALRGAGPWRVWKALRMRDATDLARHVAMYSSVADGILLDGYSAAAAGGTGTSFPWEEVARERPQFPRELDLIVAGGLMATNLERIVGLLSPDIVDVSSGVEETRGIKSEPRVREFIAAARPGAGRGTRT